MKANSMMLHFGTLIPLGGGLPIATARTMMRRNLAGSRGKRRCYRGRKPDWILLWGSLEPTAQAFDQIRHQPWGLTTPSTCLHAFGDMNRRQLAQFWLPFGDP